MAKQIEGVYERILECAKKEFLEKGFKEASLRVIAKEAQTSTGSIYTRFKDKDGLFCAIVNPLLCTIKELANKIQNQFDQMDAKEQEEKMAEFSIDSYDELLDFIYDHEEGFMLLLNCSQGSSVENFMDSLVELEVQSTIQYLKMIGNEKALENPMTSQFVQFLSASYVYGLFEPLQRHMSREKAHEFDSLFTQYHSFGFNSLFGNK